MTRAVIKIKHSVRQKRRFPGKQWCAREHASRNCYQWLFCVRRRLIINSTSLYEEIFKIQKLLHCICPQLKITNN